jgi:hypothetical protein
MLAYSGHSYPTAKAATFHQNDGAMRAPEALDLIVKRLVQLTNH